MASRISRFQKILRNKQIDVALVKDKSDVLYLTNLKADNGFLIVPRKGKPVIITSVLDSDNIKGFSKIVYKSKKEKIEIMKEILNGKIGYESNASVSFLKSLKKLAKGKFYDIYGDILSLRSVKDKNEVEYIKKATKIANEAFEIAKRGKREIEIWKKLKKFFLDNYGDEFCIVQSDENSAGIHKKPSNKKVKSLLLIDIGPKYKEYITDITRTFIIKKDKTKEKVYNIVLEAQEKAISLIREGVKASDIDKIIRDVFRKYNLERYFLHSSGHGVGLDVHELPNISEDSKDILKAGNVLTIEPGLYFKEKFGIRIEDVILVKKKGYKNLSSFIKK
ncbi:MAG: aminopeptidase P family protein [Nanoarchaeota archaeon]|nr:aminopeptidase P family protein [Nanoarchaeota archaeon]